MDENPQAQPPAGFRGELRGFAELLRRHRLASGLTQEELANRAGLSARGISDLERGLKRTPRRITVELLADALRLSEEGREELRLSVGGRARSVPDTSALNLSNLPAVLTSFVGREKEVDALCNWLLSNEVRLLTLTGAAGAGKTRLALEAAETARERFADGVCFVGLAPVTDPSEVRSAIAAAVADRDEAPHPLRGEPGGYLRHKRMLLVLDNFEHVAEAAVVVSGLLGECPGLKALVTSRAALRLAAEHVHEVAPLSLPDEVAGPTSEHTLCSSEALRLFVQRAGAVSEGFELGAANAPVVAEICRRLDGLPLAIELAAARTRILTPEEILEELQRPLELLRGGPRDAPERHRALRDTLHWSYELLAESEKELFARLSVFAGGFDLEAVRFVSGDEVDGAGDVVDVLSSLVDASLVMSWEGSYGCRRFGMLQTIREYAAERLNESEQAERVRRLHASHYLWLAERAEPELQGPDQAGWFERLEAENANFRAALEWARSRGETEQGLRLAAALWRPWHTRGYLEEGLRWLKAFLEMERGVPALLRAEALNGAGVLAAERGGYGEAEGFFEECLRLREAVGDKVEVARAYGNLGVVAGLRGDYERAERLYEQDLAYMREAGNETGIAGGMGNLGATKLYKGDLIGARRLLEEGLLLRRRLSMVKDVAGALNNLGLVALYRGDHAEALRLLEEGMEVAHELGDVELTVESRRAMGLVMLDSGRAGEAVRHLRWALRKAYRCGNAKEIVEGLSALGCEACELGRRPRAIRLWEATECARTGLGIVEHPVERSFHEKWRSRMFPQDDPEACAALEEGREMTLEEAVAYALEEAVAYALEDGGAYALEDGG